MWMWHLGTWLMVNAAVLGLVVGLRLQVHLQVPARDLFDNVCF